MQFKSQLKNDTSWSQIDVEGVSTPTFPIVLRTLRNKIISKSGCDYLHTFRRVF